MSTSTPTMTALLKTLIDKPAEFTPTMASQATTLIMQSQASQAQIAAFLTALKFTKHMFDPSILAAVASSLRDAALKVEFEGETKGLIDGVGGCVDIVGTGGDGQNTFNVSTASGIVAAGAGCFVAKHGNRASSSSCGSADVLEALGCEIAKLTPDRVSKTLSNGQFCFLFSQVFHPAMKAVASARKEIGVRTIFNILGPLTNPALPKRVVIGVFSKDIGRSMAEALHLSGVSRAWVVHGGVGLDEIAPCGETFIWSLENGTITETKITPSDFGISENTMESVRGGDSSYNSNIMNQLLSGELKSGPILDFVLLNSAALIYVAGKADSLLKAVEAAKESIFSGKAKKAFEVYRDATRA
ncbi:anthranilate phosphoribosyltransferase [Blyttiomyces sp. JEL0837]|nr:anthranilate phosphoribosyltransferase [Blyttiomyces sp. JEL0837]